MKKTYSFEYEDNSPKELTYETTGHEKLTVTAEGGQVFVFGNSAGLVTLGKLLLQLGESELPAGFHIHVRRNFDYDQPDAICVGVDAAPKSGDQEPMKVSTAILL
jgi:hypothetical protein